MTAPTNIKYNSSTANGGIMTAALISKIREAQALAARVDAMRSEVVAGDTPENLEATGSGFEVETGKGSDFNNFIGSVATHLAHSGFNSWVAKLDRGGL
jgi:hypothetical protein